MTPGQQTFTVYAAPYGVGKTLSTTVKVGGLIGSTTKLLAPLPAMSEMELLAYVYQRNRLNQGIGVAPFEQLSVLSKRVEVPLAIEYTGRTKSLKHQALVNNELPRNIVQERLGGYYEGLTPKQMQLQQRAEHLLLAEKFKDNVVRDILGNAPIIKGSFRELAALEAILTLKEEGKVIAGTKHKRLIDDVDRLVKTYGGAESDWVKKSSRNINKAPLFEKGYAKEIHWYENIKTGERFELKLKKQPIKNK